MLDDKNDNLQDADGSANNEETTAQEAQNNDLVAEIPENDQVEAIDITMAKEGKENEEVPEDLLVEDDRDEPAVELAPIEDEIEAIGEEAVIDNDELISTEAEADIAEPIDAQIAKESQENTDVPEDLVAETLEADMPDDADVLAVEADAEIPEVEAAITNDTDNIDEPAEMANTITTEADIAVNAIADSNAEDSEHGTHAAVEMKDYEAMSMDELVAEIETLSGADKVMSVKDHVEEARKAFMSKYHHFIDEKREQWHNDNPEATEDFHYHLPAKSRFDQLYTAYRDRKNKHFQSIQTDLKSNLEKRLAIVEELKNLINPQENIKDTLKHFNELRDRWKHAGPIPKDKYNHVWNNYHFHVENFYDYLHLDREARDGDFKHNLELKQRIIARAEELVNMTDANKAFRELQDLHRIWKEDIGPVSREHREEIWNRFSELTKQMHDKREAIFEKMRGSELENLEKKKEIITRLETVAEEKVGSHAAWLGQIDKVEALRNEFFAVGKAPADVNEEIWASFKTAVRNFNSLKNAFYKDIKKDQNDNLSRKQALVARAQELQESTDFAATTPIMKQIQEEWKQIGHVPRKYSDKLWKEFKAACNHYFEQMKESRSSEVAEEVEAFEKKKTYLDTLKDFQMSGDHKTDLDAIKAHIETWKNFGRVPQARRHIEGKFNKILDALFEKLSLSKKDTDMMRFTNRMESLSGSNDTRKLDNEKIFLMRKIDEVQSEIFQLENNIQFFTSKDSKKENPMVAEVRKSIEKHKEELATLKAKLKQLRSIGQE
jgi:uncharacterized coiled-coil protein SlyX